MKLTILNFTTGHIHIHNVSSQQEVMNHVDKHSEKTKERLGKTKKTKENL